MRRSILAILICACGDLAAQPRCSSQTAALLQAIEQSCDEAHCSAPALSELRGANISSFVTTDAIASAHLFFPMNRQQIDEAFDWGTFKPDDLARLAKYADRSTVFLVIGRASSVGAESNNELLSSERVKAAITYLRDTLAVNVRYIAAPLGDRATLSHDDAERLLIPALEYRRDVIVLNQSTSIFVLRCQ